MSTSEKPFHLSQITAVWAAIIVSSTASVTAADQLLVPQQYPGIQQAVDAAIDGDTVVISPGTWLENVVIAAKSITIASADPNEPSIVRSTILDGSAVAPVISLPDAVDTHNRIAGLTITNGEGGGSHGGGVDCPDGFATIEKCILTANKGWKGGAVFNDTGNLTVINSTFIDNTESSYGAGIYSFRGELTCIDCNFVDNSSNIEGGGIASDHRRTTIIGCTFTRNWASYGGAMHNSHYAADAYNCLFISNSSRNGGAISCKDLRESDRTLRISNCTFYDNFSEGNGGAISLKQQGEALGNLIIANSILWDNIAEDGPQIAVHTNGFATISYCCIQGGQLDLSIPSATLNFLAGNIDADPLFADPTFNDFHLQSTTGRWDPNLGDWTLDGSNSPAINAGDPNSNWTAEPWPNGQRINMGAYGATVYASKSYSPAANIADIDASGGVGPADLKPISAKWLIEQPLMREDLNGDRLISLGDIAVLLENWGWTIQQ